MALGQFYHVAVDNRRPYRVYGGLQDNGTWGGPSQTLRPSGPEQRRLPSTSAAATASSAASIPTDPDLVYAESQDGNLLRRNLKTGGSKSIRPKAQAGRRQVSLQLEHAVHPLAATTRTSSTAPATTCSARSSRATTCRIISPEITRTKRGSATALAESPQERRRPLGRHRRRRRLADARRRQDLDQPDATSSRPPGCPGPRWVATIEASRARPGRCYVVFDAHRSDDDEPYVFVTEDFGQTWKSLRAQPAERVVARAARGHRQPGPALPGHRVRRLGVDQPRQLVVQDQRHDAADGRGPRVRPADDGAASSSPARTAAASGCST